MNKVSEDGDVIDNPASLEGAEFTIKFYAGQYTHDDLPSTATRQWVVKTMENARGKFVTGLNDKYKISGDEFYRDDKGNVTLPLGTVTIEETKAPAGYTLKNKLVADNNEKHHNKEMAFHY